MRLCNGLMLFAFLILATGCSTKEDKEKPTTAAATVRQQDIEVLQQQIRSLVREVSQLQLKARRYQSLPLDPTEKGYGRIDTSSGFFLVAVRDAKPYLDGYRLILAIGNPTTARYNGFKLKLKWQKPMPEQKEGESDEHYSKRLHEWIQSGTQSGHEKEFAFTETLYPSSWNPISLTISPATAEELKELEIVSMETSQVSFANRK